jgi:hypothetical protein
MQNINAIIISSGFSRQVQLSKLELLLWLIKHHHLKVYGGVEIWLHYFLISAIDGGEFSYDPYAEETRFLHQRESKPSFPVIELLLWLIKHHHLKVYRGVEIWLH